MFLKQPKEILQLEDRRQALVFGNKDVKLLITVRSQTVKAPR